MTELTKRQEFAAADLLQERLLKAGFEAGAGWCLYLVRDMMATIEEAEKDD